MYESNSFVVNVLPDEVEVDFYVFGATIKDEIIGESYSRGIVVVDGSWSGLQFLKFCK